jgi:serine/threonine-protein kinase
MPPFTSPSLTDLLARLASTLSDRYRIERELGQGGMATVYLAQDLKHGRRVAIKVLRPELAAVIGADRFLREIRTLATLQHPHILGLIDSGEVQGTAYYVMPFVDGESLRDRLAREKQLPIPDALRIATEVAGALDYAHRHGIIHRDIKPENVMLHDGSALVTDFGIALAVSSATGSRMTETGMSLGTPHYMSPEQAMGEREITPRSDIYALGAMTYEMLLGEPPFTGPTAQAIVAKVMTEKPAPLIPRRPRIAPAVEDAVLTALEKLPADRFGSAAAFAAALDGPADPRADGPTRSQSVRPSVRLPVLLATVLVTGAIAAWLGRRSAPVPERWSAFVQLTDASGVETGPTISPDGDAFAYSSNARGTWDIYVQRVGGRNPVLVAGDSADEVWPAYSPDGKQIAYGKRDDGIFVMGATGESPRRLTTFGANPAWSPDGRQIVFGSEEVLSAYNVSATGKLWVVDASGGAPRKLTTPTGGEPEGYQPAWSPSGGRIAFWTAPEGVRDIVTMPAGGGDLVFVTRDDAVDFAPIWSPDGRFLYFASDRGGTMGIWRVGIDERSGRARGGPEPIASGVDVAMDLPHLSRDGRTLLFRSKIESVNPAAIAFDANTGRAGAVTLLQHRTGILVPTDASRDGKWISLYNVLERQQDVFIMRTDGTGLIRLTDDAARDWTPRFAPDGKTLTFWSNEGGRYNAWSMQLDGSGRTRLSELPSAIFAMFAPDGARLMVAFVDGGGLIGTAPWPLTEKSGTTLGRLEVGEGRLVPVTWSWSGRWLAGYIVMPSGAAPGHGLLEIATGKVTRLNDDSDGYDIAWLPGDRRVLYFTRSGALVMQDVATLERVEVMKTLPYPPDLLRSLGIAPDGKTIYYGAQQIEANIWMVQRTEDGH